MGDAADLTALARLLRKFSEVAGEMSVADGIPGSKSRAGVTLVAADDTFGIREIDGSFNWRLNAWQASRVAERIEVLTLEKVGSDGRKPREGVAG